MRVAATLIVFLGCLPFVPLQGQSTAELTGRIEDATGAVLPGVQVIVTNVGTGAVRETLSDERGYYTFPLLEPGDYRMTVQLPGFRTLNRSGVKLAVNQAARIDFVLEVGEVVDEIEVVGAAPVVDRETGALGTVVGRENLENLPLQQRNPYLLGFLVPGVSPSTRDITGETASRYSVVDTFMVSGGRIKQSAFLLDGAVNTVSWGYERNSVPALPPMDGVQEFKIQTNSYSAEFGRSAGGVVNMIMRSGTNQFHGGVYNFVRNSELDANSFFANRAGRELPSFKRNQFGANLGGPIVRDKFFFFLTYEGLRARQASTTTTTLPTELQRQGDFSETFALMGGNCVPVQIFDPSTTRSNPDGSGLIRDPFPGNVIPSSRIDPVAQRMLQFYPAPNQSGAPCTGTNNFFSQKSSRQDSNQIDARVDWNLGNKDEFFAGFNWMRFENTPANHYGNPGTTGRAPQDYPSRGFRVSYTRTETPTFLLNFRFSTNHAEEDTPAKVEDLQIADLGFPPILQEQMTKPIDVPALRPSGYGGIGSTCCGFAFLSGRTYNFAATATWVRGKQSIKFGVDVRRSRSLEDVGFGTNGNFFFNRGFTQGPSPLVSRTDRGDGMASLLLGLGTGLITTIEPLRTTSEYYAFFIQDDINITPRLTLNLGLRYDIETGREAHEDRLGWFDFMVRNPLSDLVTGIGELRGGMRYQGIDGEGRQYDTNFNNVGPRLGFAYSLSPNTVIRGGYGVFHPPFYGAAGGQYDGFTGFQRTTTWLSSLDGVTPLNHLSNAFPTGLELPTGSSQGLLTNAGGTFGALFNGDLIVDRTMTSGYMQQWNLNIQRQLPGEIALELGYVGSKGTKLTYENLNINQLHPDHLQLGQALLELVPNPFHGVITTAGPLAETQVTRAQLLRPYPQFLDMVGLFDAASSIYHSFQMRLQRQYASGISFLVSYTNSKLINDSDDIPGGYGARTFTQNFYNRRADRSLSTLDVSQRLVASWIYELPFGAGNKWGSNWPAWLDGILGNWDVNAILTLDTGFPVTVTAPNTSGSFSDVLYPNVNGNARLTGDRTTDERLGEWFNTRVFSQPAPFTFGDGPRTLPNVRSHGARNLDISVFKNFPLSDQVRLQLRGEFINALNTPRFGDPQGNLGSSNFGVVSSQANEPRQIQFALKLTF